MSKVALYLVGDITQLYDFDKYYYRKHIIGIFATQNRHKACIVYIELFCLQRKESIMQTVVRVGLGVFLGMWSFVISLLLIGKLFGTALLGLLF